MGRNRFRLAIVASTFGVILLATGCSKNVDNVEFNKWGNSFVPVQRNTSGMDTTAQGGASQNGVVPQNLNNKIPKASLGGTYHRTSATSPNYRLVGGFHVNASQ